jgi:hypothetical protein
MANFRNCDSINMSAFGSPCFCNFCKIILFECPLICITPTLRYRYSYTHKNWNCIFTQWLLSATCPHVTMRHLIKLAPGPLWTTWTCSVAMRLQETLCIALWSCLSLDLLHKPFCLHPEVSIVIILLQVRWISMLLQLGWLSSAKPTAENRGGYWPS